MDKIGKLKNEWGDKLEMFAYSYVHSWPVAEDLVQDTFLKLLESRTDVSKIENAGSFLYAILKNRCLDWIKHKLVEEKHITDIQQMNYLKASKYALEDDSISYITDIETYRILKSAIDSLPQKTKEIFVLNKLRKKKYSEIALLYGISQRSVEYQITKAMSLLKKRMGAYYIILLLCICDCINRL